MSRFPLGCALSGGLCVLALAVTGAIGSGCSGPKTGETRSPYDELDAQLRPAVQAASFKRLPSAHLATTYTMRISAPGADAGRDERATPDAITTKTELWLDRRGQYRLVETNDQDGGRQVVRYGHDIAVALRYGKMVRRPALEPEPTRFLEEAVGPPWAAWETVRRFANVTKGPTGFQLARSPRPVAAVVPAATTLRRWRDTVEVTELTGEARFDPRTGALLAFTLNSRFTITRSDGVPLTGEVSVSTRIDGIGRTAPIVPPAAEELEPRPRSILDERALLGDLTRAAGKEAR